MSGTDAPPANATLSGGIVLPEALLQSANVRATLGDDRRDLEAARQPAPPASGVLPGADDEVIGEGTLRVPFSPSELPAAARGTLSGDDGASAKSTLSGDGGGVRGTLSGDGDGARGTLSGEGGTLSGDAG